MTRRGSFEIESGTPSCPELLRVLLLGLLSAGLVCALALVTASAAQAAPKTVVGWIGNQGPASGTQGGEFNTPRDVAINETGAGGVPAGTIYTAENGRVQRFNPNGDFVAAWGQDVQGVNETQVLNINGDAGTYTLSFEGDTTLPIAWDALPTVVDTRLGELPSIGGAANVNVTGCTGFCNRPFTRIISFIATLAGTDVPQIVPDGSALGDSSGTTPPSIGVETQTNGGGGTFPGYEICTQANICSGGVATPPAPAISGALDGSTAIEVDQTDGSVYVADRDLIRVQKYSSTGEPTLVFGRDVNQTVAGTLAEVCTAVSGDICKTGVNGTAGGQFTRPSIGAGFGLAVVPAGLPNAGNVLVADPNNVRFQEFTKDGEFIRAAGWDVVMPGKPENIAGNEVQEVVLNAVGGTFRLTFSGQTTAVLPFNATAAQVEAALIALSNLDDVNVSGGPGDATGSTPYEVEFAGNQADKEVPTMVPNADSLVTPVGRTRSCSGSQTETVHTHGYQWLRNGVQIPGATESTYTPVAADEGKVVQCQTFAFTGDGGSTQASVPPAFVGTEPSGALPAPPATLPDPIEIFDPTTENMLVGGDGGAEIECIPGSWTGSPSFSYQWYRNGVALSGNGAGTKTYTVQTVDLATKGVFQCAVTGTNSAGSVTKMSRVANSFSVPDTSPRPEQNAIDRSVLDSLMEINTPTPGAAFEVCTIATDCKAGAPGEVVSNLPVGIWPAGQFSANQAFRIAVDSAGDIYMTDTFPINRLQKFTPDGSPPGLSAEVFGKPGAPTGVGGSNADDQVRAVVIGPEDRPVVLKEYPGGSPPVCADDAPIPSNEFRLQELSTDGQSLLDVHMACARMNVGIEDFAANTLTGEFFVPTRTISHRVMFVNEPIDPGLSVAAPEPTSVSATISGLIEPNPGGYPNAPGTSFQVEYKSSSASEWIKYLTPTSIGNSATPVPYTLTIYPLLPNTDYDVRVVARKEFNSAKVTSTVQSFTTLEDAPEIESLNATDVRADSADLNAIINPRGSDTSYYFEYGKTPEFGSKIPISAESIGSGQGSVKVTEHIENLDPVTYFFRVTAESTGGKTVSVNQSFNFYPETCPNSDLRQQTGAAYLPDCRAYEIASPENAGGTVLYTWAGPATGRATNPSRLSFLAVFGGIPDTGDPPGTGEMYVATRTDSGWKTKYIGLPAKEAFQSGFLPTQQVLDSTARSYSRVPASPAMDRFVIWNWGYRQFLGQPNPYIEFSPYILDHEANVIERWPTNLQEYPASQNFASTQVKVSEDLTHFVFNSDKPFAPGGLPGDFYVNDTISGTVEIVSRDPEGGSFEGKGSILDVSDDGSHILMSKQGYSPCTTTFGVSGTECNPRVPTSVFYMRIAGTTYDVTDGHLAKYQGMSDDGSKVYFLSDEQVTNDDSDTSTDLFVWRAASNSIERVSVGVGGAGNGDLCTPVSNWTPKCSVVPVSYLEQSEIDFMVSAEPEFFHAYSKTGKAGEFGNGVSDNFLSSESGDIMFFSPEQLTGSEGVDGRSNLYLYRNGELDFVASFDVDRVCHDNEPGSSFNEHVCADAQIGRIQMSPDGRFTAFSAMSRLTGFDNDKKEVMYRYDADADELLCVSCPQDGSKPAFHVRGSTNGLFMTDDGRVFFATKDAVVPPDTNEGLDIYEFVGGRPQLISNGLAPEDEGIIFGTSPFIREGLVGVSADGTDAYFATRATLTPQDLNGGNMKIYNARVNGGFAVEPKASPCAAADECHGGSSTPPPPLVDGSSADRGAAGNNVVAPKPRRAKGRKACRVKKRGKRARRVCAKKRKRAAKRKRASANRRVGR